MPSSMTKSYLHSLNPSVRCFCKLLKLEEVIRVRFFGSSNLFVFILFKIVDFFFSLMTKSTYFIACSEDSLIEDQIIAFPLENMMVKAVAQHCLLNQLFAETAVHPRDKSERVSAKTVLNDSIVKASSFLRVNLSTMTICLLIAFSRETSNNFLTLAMPQILLDVISLSNMSSICSFLIF